MKIIKLKGVESGEAIYINIEQIIFFGGNDKKDMSYIQLVDNCRLYVTETPKQIVDLIRKAENR